MDEGKGSKQGRKSRGDASPTQHNRQSVKVEVCQQVLRKLAEAHHDLLDTPGFAEGLQAHFNRLPARYALDVNAERAEDVLTHKDLLVIAEMPENRPAFHIRAVHVFPVSVDSGEEDPARNDGSAFVGSPMRDDTPTPSGRTGKINVHPPPTFGSTPNFDDIDVDLATDHDESEEGNLPHAPMHEVCFSTIDKPKLLSQLSSLLADVNLNIREAHVFSTSDGYSLDVFVVDGWHTEDTKELGEELERVLANMEEGAWSKSQPQSPRKPPAPASTIARADSSNDWEIDSSQLKLGQKVASGAFGDLYRGTYCGQDVAVKILKHDQITETLQNEFQHELFIMRKIRHKNVVQFIGACTKPPNLSIVTEFMTGGSVYDHIHKHKTLLKVPMVLRAAIDISKGMDYLHQNNIIHRDLKAANLLLDENEVVKVADFGVARVQDQRGIMTAETGTYRWMAPEVIEHKAYDRKVDVFSFGIVLWELLTGKLPYADLTPLQAAVGVVQKGLRPSIPKHTNPKITSLLERCWKKDPTERPDFAEITIILTEILREVDEEQKRGGDHHKKGFLSALKRTAGNR